MPPSPHLPESFLHSSSYSTSDADTFSERHHTDQTRDNSHSTNCFEDTLQSSQAGALHDSDNAWNQLYVPANDFRQSNISNPDVDASTQGDHVPPSFEAMPRFGVENGVNLLRGVAAYTQQARPGSWNLNSIPGRGERQSVSGTSPQGYNTHTRSVSLASPALAHMQSLQYPSSRHSSAPPQAPGTTKFAPFGGLFSNGMEAKHHRRVGMRFDRNAYNPNDPTVAGIEADRAKHVERIYNAMVRGDKARDNDKSVAMKRWTREPHYASDMVEAYAHKVFDCLLEQSKDGFRGWHHNDYVVDDRKGDDADRDIDCAGRLENIVLALEQEKTICEDVMNSACQIRMFVNAPRAYANRKHQNRIGNSKRPNATAKDDGEFNPRASKVRKMASNRSRGRSSTLSDVTPSRTSTPQQPLDAAGLPYFVIPASQYMASSPASRTYLASKAPLVECLGTSAQLRASPFQQRPLNVMSQPALSPRATQQTLGPGPPPRITSMPPARHSPFSPSTFTHDYHSAPVTPDDAKMGNVNMPVNPWCHSKPADESTFQQSIATDDSAFTQVIDWSQNVPPFAPCEGSDSANLFANLSDGYVSLADIEGLSSNQIDSVTTGNADFENMWQQRGADEHFSYDDLPSELRPQS